ncbi:DUF3365 domain-containing protein [Stieleria sp. JC731]|uniref:c-type heme family protein n=1 Tax=Pirellulaceae TaxID=2691357 RepID=UPI001E2C9D82|nr:DUF3365 domain-containing protein [Stieleria sp. JC731]MCC9601076.1 DUF3365 domain-containing protein [Stieleria sp. JC731]
MNAKRVQSIRCVACLALVTLVLGCRKDVTESPAALQTETGEAVTIVADSQPTEEQRAEMIASKDALFQQLSTKLMSAMAEGPATAIAVCQKEASQIANAVGKQHGVKIGRVGVRLRNPNNTGPDWATSMIASKQDTPVFAKLSNGNAAALLPIKLQVQCLMCHGPNDQIAPVIQDQLAKLYPSDEATGFQEGELRGWFWVEKPPAGTQSKTDI